MLAPQKLGPKRLVWLEGIRMIAAVMILIYHAQLYFSDYGFTPEPTGLISNLRQLVMVGDYAATPLFIRLLSTPFWFGFQFLDVFILISGFSLVLSLKGQPLELGQFLKRRLVRLLFPFWTVAWLSYPILWIIGTLSDGYKPDAWHSFAGITFPLTADYRGSLLLSTSGPWWFVPLVISFTLIFPLLWHLLQRWGMRNLLLFSLTLTVGYRILAVYVLGGHPTYVLLTTPANEEPFQLFLSKLSTFVIGIAIAIAYQQGHGPLFWNQRRALTVGILIYVMGFICQFYQAGWVVADLILPLGLGLMTMAITRSISQFAVLKTWLIRLGACSYSYFLIHNFVVDRTINLFVHGNLTRYLLALPGMIGLTLLLALGADKIRPTLQQLVLRLWNGVDSLLCHTYKPKQSSASKISL